MMVVDASFILISDMVRASQDSDYTYTVSGGVATIVEYIGAGGVVRIPSTLGEYPTVAIKDQAFASCSTLTSVIIPDSVTSIGNNTFYNCNALTSVTIGNGVTTLGYYAFESCSALTTVTIGRNLTTIGPYAFYHCTSLTTMTIPDSITDIGNNAFDSCSALTSVTIGNGVTTIWDETFIFCKSLTTITIGNNVTTIENNAFDSCTSLTSLTIGRNVTTIGPYAFYSCSSLTTVTIPSSVIAIGDSAFRDCSSLTSITFLGSIAPTNVVSSWILNTSTEIRGHAYVASNFPAPGSIWNGLTMGEAIVSEHKPPIASFTWTPPNPKANQTITFDASASNDPDGSLTLYEWDWNNDSVYEESHTAPTATHTWPQAGNYSVTLRVTDNHGSTTTKIITISISSGGGTPGFESMIAIGAIAFVIFWKRTSKKHD